MRKPVILGVSILMALCSVATAVDRIVPDAYPTIQAAIDAAANGDSVLIRPGTYSGPGNREISFKGKAITVRSILGPSTCIIDCGGAGRAFLFETNEKNTSILQGLTIRNGKQIFGGAIECYMASPKIQNCVLTGNTAEYGGAIDCYQASPTVFDCVIQNNTAHNTAKSASGGAIACDGSSPTITNVLFEGNITDQYGSAIDSYNASAPVVTNCTFVNNRGVTSSAYAAVFADNLSVLTKVTSCILWNNTRDIMGGIVAYSCAQDGSAGTGVINTDPLFRTGPRGAYYLSQIAAGQLLDSPCANAGDPAANLSDLGLASMSTRTDNVADSGGVDMGYHYLGGAAPVQVPLTIQMIPIGGIKPATILPVEGTANYRQYSDVSITVTPNLGYKVKKWTGTNDDTSTESTNVVTVTNAKTVSVEFRTHPTYTLTTQIAVGQGTLLPVTGLYNSGDTVTLTATAADGFRVGAWTGTDNDEQFFGQTTATVLVDKNKTVTVAFVSATISRLNVSVVGGHGSVVPRRGDYPVGTVVNLEARPDQYYRVRQWTGTDDDASTENTNTVTLNYDRNVTVEFEKIPRFWLETEVYSPDGQPHGTLTPVSGWFEEDTVVNLTATPDTGYEVAVWQGTDRDQTAPGVPNQAVKNTVTMSDDARVVVMFREIVKDPLQEGEITLNENRATLYATIQEAIDAAADGDEVVVGPGTYAGDGNRDLNPDGKAIVIRSYLGAEVTIIDCGRQARGFYLRTNEGAGTVIRGFTIRNGVAPVGDEVPASGRGGGILMMADCQAVVEDCIIEGCQADAEGAGICFAGNDSIDEVEPSGDPNDPEYDPGDPGLENNEGLIPQARLANCVIRNCSAGTNGGAVYIQEAAPVIVSCQILNCRAEGGAAIYSLGIENQDIHPAVINCLIVQNQSRAGNGVISAENSSPTIQLCTLTRNMMSGGIFALTETSIPQIDHCILDGNGDELDGCSSTVSCVTDLDFDSIGQGNVYDDPIFIAGPQGDYYLSQALGNQPDTQWSPCVDMGQTGLFTWQRQYGVSPDITTAVTDADDSGRTDLGYHYPKVPLTVIPTKYKFKLYPAEFGSVWFRTVNNAKPASSIEGTVLPDADPAILFVDAWSVVRLRAIGDSGYRINTWRGTDNDASRGSANKATMIRDREITVTFAIQYTRVLTVPDVYLTIEDAVTAAYDGDVVMVRPGVHYLTNPDGVDFEGREIKLVSVRPDDPATIAATVIDCQGSKLNPKRAFYFHGGEGNGALIAGFTIRGGWMNGGLGTSAPRYRWPAISPDGPNFDPPNDIRSAFSGGDKIGDGYGGAILCRDGSSPTIQYCVFSHNTVTGAQGNRGQDGLYQVYEGNYHSQPGGHGGDGTGNGYGGAIACVSDSSPIVRYCRFEYNKAHGGVGGDGGDAGDISDTPSPGNESRGGDGGDGYGVGQGGAIYSDLNSNPIIYACEFVENKATDAIAGRGGSRSPSGNAWANWPASDGADGMTFTNGETVWGGAVFYDTASVANFEYCSFIGNKAYVLDIFSSVWTLWDNPPSNEVYSLGGAMYIGLGNTVNLSNCSFENNLGGALYCEGDDILSLQKCQFWKNGTELNIWTPYYKFFSMYSDYNYYSQTYSQMYDSPPGALNIGPNCPDVQVIDCDFGENFTFGFGGAVLAMSDSRFSQCRFGGNRSEISGGAVYSDARQLFAGTTIPQLTFEQCSFRENEANEGGAVYLYTTQATFDRCNIFSNTAQNGGGLYLADTWVEILGGMMVGNVASSYDAQGGGIGCFGATMTIRDCIFENNRVEGQGGFGGAVSIFGGDAVLRRQSITNCLFSGNYAEQYGGALALRMLTVVKTENCTFASNTSGGMGGGIFSDWCSTPTVVNSILTGNAPQAIYEEWINYSPLPRGDSIAQYCLFYGNTADLYDSQTRTQYTGAAQINSLGENRENIDTNPLYATGPLGAYYLGSSSPAVNKGSGSSQDAGLDTRTTQVNNALDSGIVDLGYHYLSMTDVPRVALSVSVVGGHGTVTPVSGSYYVGQIVALTANPNAGYRVDHWGGGTVNDSSQSLTNIVLMDSDKQITVQFKQPRVLVVGSRPEYTDIQGTIDAAEDGDVVMLMPGLYQPPEDLETLTFRNKDITLTSSNPDKPGVVDATILRNYDFLLVGASKKTVIDGITFDYSTITLEFSHPIIQNSRFKNGQWYGGDGRDGNGSDGENGGGVIGGAIVMWFSSPQLLNCDFQNCSLTGGNGGRGANFSGSHVDGWDGGWGGKAYGGAVYLGFMSNPVFDSCSFVDCFVQGGRGGDGGDGDAGNNGYGGRGGGWTWAETLEYYWFDWWDGWELGERFNDINIPYVIVDPALGAQVTINMQNRYPWERFAKWFGFEEYLSWDDWITNYTYDAFMTAYDDYWRYSGLGGAVYCEMDSNPTFRKCFFQNCRSYSSISGIGGNGVNSAHWPLRNLVVDNGGGAIFATRGCKVTMIDTTFKENIADPSTAIDLDGDPETAPDELVDDYFVSFGGAIAYTDECVMKAINSNFISNQAAIGGGFFFDDALIDVADCNFIDNMAYHGGGLYSAYSTGQISNTYFKRNLATAQTANSSQDSGSTDSPILLPALPNDVRYGHGAGVFCLSSELDVLDSVFTGNTARGNGGGIYYLGAPDNIAVSPQLFNSLFYDNTAPLGGGGVAAAFYARPNIVNCTIADNRSPAGNGGGVLVSYNSQTDVLNSIIWDNVAVDGSQLAVGSGDEFGPLPSTVSVMYSDIGPEYDPSAALIHSKPILPPPSLDKAYVTDAAAIQQMFATNSGKANVIVTLFQPTVLRKSMNWNDPAQVKVYRTEVADRINAVLKTLGSTDYTLRQRYENFAGFSATINQTALDALLTNPMVSSIEPVRPVRPLLRQSIALANAGEMRAIYNGTGVAVAIVDSGIDYTHPMLGGGTFPNQKVIGGYDVGDNDADPMPSDEPHGTACAGIAAGSLGEVGDYIGGVAYNAKLYALKLTGDDGSWANDAGLRAWDWCITHQNDDPANPILVMSNSWGGMIFFQDSATADAFSPAATQTAALAVERGITILGASGNEYQTQGIIWPAAMSNVISVGAVYDTTDQVTPYSNTHEILDILAPADPMYTTDMVGAAGYTAGDYTPDFAGTSSATPFAAGCVADIQVAAREILGRYLMPQEVRELLIRTGDPVTDTKAPITKPRVNLGMAIMGIMPPKPILVEQGSILDGWDDATQTWAANTFNFMKDPELVRAGEYFLSEIAAGQLKDSPCLNAGSGLASVLGLDIYTTRSDSVMDQGIVNLGYHHRPFEPEYFLLQTAVYPSGLDSLFGYYPTITPYQPEGILVKQYTQLELKIQPEPPTGYDVIWTGTDDDENTTWQNTVTVDKKRKAVTAQFTKAGFKLDTQVTVDPELLPGFAAEITPSSGFILPLTRVRLSVTPPPAGFQVRWSGTDKDGIVDSVNYVTMVRDTKVRAWYEKIEVKYYAVLVGVNDVIGNYPILNYAEADASQLCAALLQRPEWTTNNIYLLLGKDATVDRLTQAFLDLRKRMDPDDILVFFFAGHGFATTDTSPIDELDGFDEYLILSNLEVVSDDQVAKWLGALPSHNYAVFLDTGFNTASATAELSFAPRGLGINIPKPGDDFGSDLVPHQILFEDGTLFMADPNGLGVVVSAAQGNQAAWEYSELGHGLLTYYLLKAINGSADQAGNKNGWASGEECFVNVAQNLSAWLKDWDEIGALPDSLEQQPAFYDASTAQEIDFVSSPVPGADPRTFYIPGAADSIQQIINLARDGDLIVLAANTYQGGGLVIDKNITITSANPDDPEVVAATIIDCSNTVNTGVYFTRNAGPGAVLNGITIRNGVWTALPPETGTYDGRHIAGGGIVAGYQSSPTIKNCVISGFRLTGGNAIPGPGPDGDDGGFALGAGIFCAEESAPTIINTTITDCHVVGGNATSGVNASPGDPAANPPVPASPVAGRGGWGGGARGGGVYIAAKSAAVFQNCTITNCTATGGNGGNGGNYARLGGLDVPGGYGGLWSDSSYAPWQAWGYVGDYRYYAGSGAGVYCEVESRPKFLNCLISANQTRGGISGRGGTMPAGQDRQQPITAYEVPSYGGGVFCGEKVRAEFVHCRFYDNIAPKPSTNYTLSSSLGHGGGIAFERSASIVFDTCSFQRNNASVGAGMYYLDDSPMIADCNFVANNAYQGGGLFADGGAGTIENTQFLENIAGDPTLVTILGQGGAIASVNTALKIHNSQIINNSASTSGGGVFFSGLTNGSVTSPTMSNVLVVENNAGRDGGGISANWGTRLKISNCTIAYNRATGVFGQVLGDGLGGGLYAAYHSQVDIIDSIFWANSAASGVHLLVGTGFEFDPRPGTVSISYTDIPGGWSEPFVVVEDGCTLNQGAGNLISGNLNPLFVTGPLGDYYLSQLAANQTVQSPCVDAGSAPASSVGMNLFTTRTDSGPNNFDSGRVDMGFHYPLTRTVASCRTCDLPSNGRNGWINLADFAVLASEWLRTCSHPGWCQGADINRDFRVDLIDLLPFTACWLSEDVLAPRPNPAEWGTRRVTIPVPGGQPGETMVVVVTGKPTAVSGSTNQIIMSAMPAVDDWGWEVAYQFECIKIDNTTVSIKSPWLYYPPNVEPTWTATGLLANTTYTYVVRVAEIRVPGTLAEAGITVNPTGFTILGDAHVKYVSQNAPYNSNWTLDSIAASARTGQESNPPAPIAWEVVPFQLNPTSISMTAAVATDENPPVSYIFLRYQNATDVVANKRFGPTTNRTWVDTDVRVGETWTYTFYAVDNLSNASEEAPRITVTFAAGDINPPTPNPMEWDPEYTPIRQFINGQWWDYMRVAVATDPEGAIVQYQVRETQTGYQSLWQVETDVITGPDGSNAYTGLSFWVPAGGQFTVRRYQCRARDTSANLNTTAWSTPALPPR